jgi:hypothetical protein
MQDTDAKEYGDEKDDVDAKAYAHSLPYRIARYAAVC